ncbi:MAG TPA: 16S rRNA (cytosine(1402)-N(4))-methyltransferase RsmH [Gammaproteobacteria bacterium]|nr:16S rRNA (cytosine(1402)-N(4))-methyltransferase RsmH [Gammaproteobacteria bacterium]
MEAGSHQPVMVQAVMDALRPAADGVYIDCTFGRGGHARALLSALGPAGRVIALDRDPAAIAAGRELAAEDARLKLVQAKFSSLEAVASSHEVCGKVNGVLLDLGVSSPQLEDETRGFSFQQEGPLDMRMDPDSGISAAEWLGRAGEQEIASVLFRFGEERHSRRIARAICEARRKSPLRTTRQLAQLVERAVPRVPRKRHGRRLSEKHPATRVFQAVRIFINRELEELEAGLEQSVTVLTVGGRLVTISFHSLEDRIVKRFMRAHSRSTSGYAQHAGGAGPLLDIVSKPARPGDDEIRVNPRARSAIMRVAEKRS